MRKLPKFAKRIAAPGDVVRVHQDGDDPQDDTWYRDGEPITAEQAEEILGYRPESEDRG